MYILLFQMEIVKRLNAIIAQILPFLSQDHQQQVATAVERAKQITMADIVSTWMTNKDDTMCEQIIRLFFFPAQRFGAHPSSHYFLTFIRLMFFAIFSAKFFPSISQLCIRTMISAIARAIETRDWYSVDVSCIIEFRVDSRAHDSNNFSTSWPRCHRQNKRARWKKKSWRLNSKRTVQTK